MIYLSAAAGALINRDQYRRIAEDMFKNAALTYLMGFTAAIVGMIIVNYHNIWVGNWTVLITILGWFPHPAKQISGRAARDGNPGL